MGILIYLLLGALVFILFVAYRNHWVYKMQTEILFADDYPETWDRLQSYNKMMLKFWVFDIEKFLK